MLRKAKQDDSELLVGLLPLQVFEKKWEHFHQLICMLPFLVVVFVYFSADCESLPFFSDLVRDVHARACVDRINEGVSSLHAIAVTRFLHDGKKRDCSSSNLLPPFFFLNFFMFVLFHFFLTGHFQHHHHLNYGSHIHSSYVQINFRDCSSQGLELNQEIGNVFISIKSVNFWRHFACFSFVSYTRWRKCNIRWNQPNFCWKRYPVVVFYLVYGSWYS